MIALQITDTKDFTTKLFLQEVFDPFWVVEGSLRTHCTLRPLCFDFIKGKKTPLGFKFSFRLSDSNTEKLLGQSGVSLSLADVAGLFLNIRYQEGKILVTTGTSLRLFTTDKSLDHAWDAMVQRFFKQKEMAFYLL